MTYTCFSNPRQLDPHEDLVLGSRNDIRTNCDMKILVTFILKRYNSELQTSEMFTTAGRTVKSGLVGSAVVSSWTWAATLLQSSGVCYRYGVSGPFWYASGATVQILLFATLAIELKRRAPNAHTFLEV